MGEKLEEGCGESTFVIAKSSLLYLCQNHGLSHSSKEHCRELLDTLIKNRDLKENELKQLDALMTEYLEKNVDNWNEYLMVDDIPMSLTMDRVQENSKFYNKLFEKHSIDYGV